jgi:mandelate racemase
MTVITSIYTTPVLSPLARPLKTASGHIENFPLVLIDLHTDSGVSGHAYAEIYLPELLPALESAIAGLGLLVVGQQLQPRDLYTAVLKRLRLWGAKNLIGAALGALDMAWWDAYARCRDEPLYKTLGCAPRAVPVYMSAGMYDAASVVEVAQAAVDEGHQALKIKVGFANFADDLAAIRAAKRVLGPRALMIDYNQSLTPQEARLRCRALDDEGLTWIEEPVAADDYQTHAELAATLTTPIQIGENFNSSDEMRSALTLRAMDYVMPDAQFMRGVSGWLEAAALARTAQMECSSHLFPEASSHLLCATPTAHYLEWLDVANGLQAEPWPLLDGTLTPPARPGIGIEWDVAAIARYRV